jgi:mannosylglycerate hydrolase
MNTTFDIYIVPHTHWDREWYLPFEVFRKKLVDFMDSLIDLMSRDADYETFVLDGQVIIIEDYLCLRPEKAAIIESLVSGRRLSIGPWYTLPDEFLVSGEALVRNLLVGRKIARSFGSSLNVGYLPDSFGHIAQLPQILRGFGIWHFIFTRGIGNQPRSSEYLWKGSDGTEILSTAQIFAYNNAGYLPAKIDDAEKRILDEIEKMKPYLASTCVLLNNGGDHHWPQDNLPKVVSSLKARNIFQNVRIADFHHYSQALESLEGRLLPVLEGELRYSHYYPILSGVLSSRMKLKLLNHYSQNLLEKLVEPSAAMAMIYGRDYPAELLLHAWKLLLQNHAHDSICGCSIDEVHNENLGRFDKVRQIGTLILQESIASLVGAVDTSQSDEKTRQHYSLVAFNSLNSARKGPLTFKLTREGPIPELSLIDAAGKYVKMQVLGDTTREGSFPHPSRASLHERDYVFLADVPPMGYSTYHLVEKKQKGRKGTAPAEPVIENEYFKVGWDSAEHLYVIDKRSARRFTHISDFIDDADCGDEYNFSPLIGDRTLLHHLGEVRFTIVASGPVQHTLQLAGDLVLPSRLSHDRLSRSAEMVNCPFSLRVSLYSGIERIDFSLSFKNLAQDHRLRLLFPSGIEDPELYVDAPFDLLRRDLELPTGDGWIEKPARTQPQGRLAALKGKDYDFVLFNRGLPELEVGRDQGRTTFLLTLMRCVGWLSRQDIVGRSVEAGPKLHTPDAQNIDTLRYHYSLMTGTGSDVASYPQLALIFDIPIEGVLSDAHDGHLPPRTSFLSVAPEVLIVSALKKAEESDNLVLRFYNPSSSPLTYEVKSALPIRGYFLLNLEEKRMGKLKQLEEKGIAGPKAIVTLELVRKDRNGAGGRV